MTDAHRSAAYWLGSRAVHHRLVGTPLIDLSVEQPATVLERAANEIRRTLDDYYGEPTPTHRDQLLSVMISAEACRRAKPCDECGVAIALLGRSLLPEQLNAAARTFVSNRWRLIELVSAELAHEKRVSVRRICWLLPHRMAA